MGYREQPIRWDQWRPSHKVTHIDQSCFSCAFPGPLLIRYGRILQPARRVRQLTQRSNAIEGIRPKAETRLVPAYWAITHIAFRCPDCQEETVYTELDEPNMTEVPELYQAPRLSAEIIEFPSPRT